MLKWFSGSRKSSRFNGKVKGKVVDTVDQTEFAERINKKVSILHLMCTIASTLAVAIVFQQVIGATFIPLQNLYGALIAAAIYTGMVYSYRAMQKSGTCYMFQLTVTGTAGIGQYITTSHDYRMMALGTFIVLMFQNSCIDKHLLKAGKIDNGLYKIRVGMCGVMVLLSIGSYGYSFRYFPDSRGAPSLLCDETGNRAEGEYTHPQSVEQTEPVDEDNYTMPKVLSLLDKGSNILTGLYQDSKGLGGVTNLCGKQICGYPCEWVDRLKSFENDPLFTGAEVQSKAHKDKLRPDVTEVGYGVTAGEIYDAKAYGFLPKDAELPKSMTKEEADEWMEKVTLPTYDAMVCAKVKVPLTIQQRFALLSFAHNTGSGSLDKLACAKNRLNSGNLDCAPEIMRLYVNAGRHTKVAGLVKRRDWEANLFETTLDQIAFNN